MLQPLVILIACSPLLLRLLPMLIPGEYLEPYALMSVSSLNQGETKWMNMGYWKDTSDFAQANEALARRLLDMAPSYPRRVLDIAHGPGESLSLHLSQTPPPDTLDALTSRPSDTRTAQQLINSRFPETNTTINWHTCSAAYRPGKDHDHPLNPMKGYLGKSSHNQEASLEIDDDSSLTSNDERPGPPGYDLIYVLDGIYHFPPALPHFLSSTLKALAPGGTIVYTDILPPHDLSQVLQIILSGLLAVPPRNLVADRGRPLSDYEMGLGKIGFVDVRIEDWSEYVWPGFAAHLRQKGSAWGLVAWGLEWAEKRGWKFVAVKASRPL